MQVNPDTGFMLSKMKQSTMTMFLQNYADGSSLQPSPWQAFPFPDLTSLIEINVPIYDLIEDLNADQYAYLDQLSYISENYDNVRSASIWMIILAAFFLVLGVVALVVHLKA